MDTSPRTSLHRFMRGEAQRQLPENYRAAQVQHGTCSKAYEMAAFSLLASLTPAGVSNPQYMRELDCWQNIVFAPFSPQL